MAITDRPGLEEYAHAANVNTAGDRWMRVQWVLQWTSPNTVA